MEELCFLQMEYYVSDITSILVMKTKQCYMIHGDKLSHKNPFVTGGRTVHQTGAGSP